MQLVERGHASSGSENLAGKACSEIFCTNLVNPTTRTEKCQIIF